jgi:hypothetical protein
MELLMAEYQRDKAIQHLDNSILAKAMASRKDWEKILRELRSLVPGIPIWDARDSSLCSKKQFPTIVLK